MREENGISLSKNMPVSICRTVLGPYGNNMYNAVPNTIIDVYIHELSLFYDLR